MNEQHSYYEANKYSIQKKETENENVEKCHDFDDLNTEKYYQNDDRNNACRRENDTNDEYFENREQGF